MLTNLTNQTKPTKNQLEKRFGWKKDNKEAKQFCASIFRLQDIEKTPKTLKVVWMPHA